MFQKAIFLVVSLWLSVGAANPQVTSFKCRTIGELHGDVVKFEFNLVNLREKGAQLDYDYIDKKAEEWGEVVRVTQPKRTSVKTLNDNYEIYREAKGIRMTGDGDGCEFVRLFLYKDSDFTKGYISIKDGGCGGDSDGYQKVSCRLRDL